MYPNLCDELDEDFESDVELQEDYFKTAISILYGPETLWTKKDVLEYNKIFEEL